MATSSQHASAVALIAIHGVGDPKPGDTAQSVARLLVAQSAYQHLGQDQWLVKVDEVYPDSQVAPPSDSAFAYSSRFAAARLGPGGVRDDDRLHFAGDPGLQLNYHLLRGTELPDEDKTYVAARHRLEKNGRQVDVVDLYWGDLSGLGGAVSRIIAELFTLIFHLCQLGRDAGQLTAWHIRDKVPLRRKTTQITAGVLANTHQAADTLFTKPNGLLNALLVLVALWWFPLRRLQEALWDAESPNVVGIVAAGLLYVLASLAFAAACYWRGQAGRRLMVAALLLAVAGLCLSFQIENELLGWHVIAIVWAVLLAVVYGLFIQFCDERIKGTLRWGIGLGALVLVTALLRVGLTAGASALSADQLWARAMLQAFDTIMVSLVVVWATLGILALIMVLAGAWLKWTNAGDKAVRGGVDTGRIGLFVSIALFITLASAAWAFAIKDIEQSLPQVNYTGFISSISHMILGSHAAEAVKAADFLHDRFNQSTLMFAPVVVVMLGLLMGAISLLFPSVVAEANPPQTGGSGIHLGRWLSVYGQGLTTLTTRTIFTCAFLFAAWGLVSVMPDDATGWREGLARLFDPVKSWSDEWLTSIAFLVAGSTAGLLVVGGKVFGSLRNVRGALDTALDVDRHFREFPDTRTPRGRIAARFLGVLTAARDQGYARIVVCAHSQGTVIAAELLRELKFRDPLNRRGLPPIYLFTCGSPLRQLYAARFPVLYEWVVGQLDDGATGPRATDLGVQRWTNAYNTGDYVGRWLWESPNTDPLQTSMNYAVGVHRQFCLGAGAHTHYYDAQMVTVAQEIDALTL